MRVSVILPTMGRAEQALRCIERMRATAGHPFELVVVVEVDETGYRSLRARLSEDDIVLFRAAHPRALIVSHFGGNDVTNNRPYPGGQSSINSRLASLLSAVLNARSRTCRRARASCSLSAAISRSATCAWRCR